MSQDCLARRTGLQRKTIYEVETGRNDSRLETVRRIASALQVELWELLRDAQHERFREDSGEAS